MGRLRFLKTAIEGVVVVETEVATDERGTFARAYSEEEFAAAGLNTEWPEHNLSTNRRRGTLRGLHYQRAPHEEIKLVRCVAGAIYDVAVDVRPGSPTLGKHVAVELSAENGRALYIPVGCAHGFQTLAEESTVFYLMSATYAPAGAAGIRHDDPALGIAWPLAEKVMSAGDRALPGLSEGA
ncbi:dTDP-4-dehydrorhamnose 3,5-epimerase [soil metagenome]